MSDWNKKIIDEFRTNDGVVGGHFTGQPLLLLHSSGAKSGKERVNPVAAFVAGECFFIFASKSGAPSNPDWYYNIVANPVVDIEFGTERFQARATVAEEPERTELYEIGANQFAAFASYKDQTDRVIPVVKLSRIS
jgi:deazaflavin-dependent oxidoreductase (nitroreductase family)